MNTIKKTVTIPADHRLRMDIEIPAQIPAGQAEITLLISPIRQDGKPCDFASLAGSLRGSPIFSRDPVTVQRELRGR